MASLSGFFSTITAMLQNKHFIYFAFLLVLVFGADQAQAQSFARVTVDQKVRDAQVVGMERDGQKFAGVLVYANNAWNKIYFNIDDLQTIKQAAQNYFGDFDSMKLKKGKKNSIKKYGTVPCFVEWGSDKKTIDRFCDTKADLGYVFVKAAPYFCVSVHPAKNQNAAQSSPAYQTFEKLSLLFTKSQITDFCQKTTPKSE